MDGAPHDDTALLGGAGLGRLMPMHIWVDEGGHIRGAGPTLAKLFPDSPLIGAQFLDLFHVRKPRQVTRIREFAGLAGRRLHLALSEPPCTALRGHAVTLGGGQGFLINLSFGISVADAVRVHSLTNIDFAPTDLTVELLYLTEVKAAVMDELGAMNERLRAAQRAAEAQAMSDALTGLANRRALDMALSRSIERWARLDEGFALVHLDLDLFKAVNDTHGHAAGDAVLVRVAEVLRAATRDIDVIARIGGDEFVLIISGPLDRAAVCRTAERIIAELDKPVKVGRTACTISGSLGVTFSDLYDQPDAARMLSDADAALYASKRAGRGRFTLHGTG